MIHSIAYSANYSMPTTVNRPKARIRLAHDLVLAIFGDVWPSSPQLP